MSSPHFSLSTVKKFKKSHLHACVNKMMLTLLKVEKSVCPFYQLIDLQSTAVSWHASYMVDFLIELKAL